MTELYSKPDLQLSLINSEQPAAYDASIVDYRARLEVELLL